MTNAPYPLGRIESWDSRNLNYPVKALMAAGEKPESVLWEMGPVMDQGSVGACVGFGWGAELAALPVVVTQSNADCFRRYYAAQLIDTIPMPHEGTTVIAGAKITKAEGHLDEYRWALSLEDLKLALKIGPVVVGTPWYENMFYPDSHGRLSVGGAYVGGHCWVLYGQQMRYQWFNGMCQWGDSYAVHGSFVISFEDMGRLLAEGGECCVPIVRR